MVISRSKPLYSNGAENEGSKRTKKWSFEVGCQPWIMVREGLFYSHIKESHYKEFSFISRIQYGMESSWTLYPMG